MYLGFYLLYSDCFPVLMVIILNVSTLIFYLLYTFVPHIFVWGSCFWLCTPACLPACLPPPPAASSQLTHTPLARTPLAHTYRTHTQLAHTNLTHTPLTLSHTHTALSHTQLSHTHRAYSHTHTYSQSQRSTIY